MTEYKRIFNICADFQEKMRGNYFIDGAAYQEPLGSIRARLWYESLKQRFSLSGPSEMEAYLEPDAVKRDESGRKKYSHNKWRQYRDGGAPRQTTLLKVEKIAPGSMYIFNHPLWEVVDLDNLKVMEGNAFLQSLPAELQVVLFDTKEIGLSCYVERVPIRGVLLKRLELKAGLDSLACLAWLLREAVDRQCSNVEEIGRSLYEVLLMMAVELYELKVGLPILQFFIDRILPLGAPRYHRVTITPLEFMWLSIELNRSVFSIQGQSEDLPWSERVRSMRRLLRGDYGLDMPQALAMPLELNLSLNPPPKVIERSRY